MSDIATIRSEEFPCPCGCGLAYPFFSGMLRYGETREVAFRFAHFHQHHAGATKHLWLLLGSGPWFEDDPRGCWLVLDSRIDGDNFIARVCNCSDSPFSSQDIFDERFLTREEVLSRKGAMQWAIDRRDDLVTLHKPTREFILPPDA